MSPMPMPASVGLMPWTMTWRATSRHGCAEGDAEADLLHAAFDRVGKHAVDADGAEDESEQAEDGEQLHVEAVLGEGFADEVFEGDHVVYGDVFIDLVYGVGYGDGEGLRWRGGADGEGERTGAPGTSGEPVICETGQ